MNKKILPFVIISICILLTACVPGPNFVVDSIADDIDSNLGDGICKTVNNECTLRAAIMEANFDADSNTITFAGSYIIKPNAPLPHLTSGRITIDGAGTATLDGSQIADNQYGGLVIESSSFNIIQGLRIRLFNYGILIDGSNGIATQNTIGLLQGTTSSGDERNILHRNNSGVFITGQEASLNTIAGNLIGTNPNGSQSKSNEYTGVTITQGAHDNLIGSLSSNSVIQGANLISGNTGTGVQISSSDSNQISGNIIGLDFNGTTALPNGEGIRITDSQGNIVGIGPDGNGYQNLISGNTFDGITLGNAEDTIIAGNFIGTNIAGTSSVPNRNGILIMSDCSSNIIGTNGDGTDDSQEGNLISGNLYDGIRIISGNSIHNVIAGNLIGTDINGTSALGNGSSGLSISGDMNLIGTNGDGVADDLEGNVISGNQTTGIYLHSFAAHVSGNFIGTDKTGMFPLGNAFYGISISPSSHGNLIGTDGDGVSDILERNIICANGAGMTNTAGINIQGADNTIAGNFIGIDATGSAGLGNEGDGVLLTSTATGNLIGTDGDGTADTEEGNLISGNGHRGVWFSGAYINTIAGNKIGADFTGSLAIPNGHALNESIGAVHLSNGASGNIIGTNSDGSGDNIEGNLISGNARRGIVIEDPTTHFNIVAGNLIGTDASGTSTLGNQFGVDIRNDSNMNQIGTDGDGNGDFYERNLISGNSGAGISIQGSDNTIAGNYIGTDNSGSNDLGNGSYGIYLIDNSANNTIGGSTLKTNIVAFNGKDGVFITGVNSVGNLISANSIFENDESGIDLSDGTATWSNLNDPGDLDSGPNYLMNYPILDSASSLTIAVAISGNIINGLPGSTFQIDFYANDTCDPPANFGEGKNYIGSTAVTTDSGGNGTFLANLSGFVPAGKFITATATNNSSTSEFSECIEVTAAQAYMEKADGEEFPCDEFLRDQMDITSSYVNQETGLFSLYVKNTGPFPQPAPSADWGYSAVLGEISAIKCDFQGFEDRLYCNFIVPEELYNTAQQLKVFSSLCGPPIYINDQVSIFAREIPEEVEATKEPEGCHSGLEERDCIAAGGEFSAASGTCICPRR